MATSHKVTDFLESVIYREHRSVPNRLLMAVLIALSYLYRLIVRSYLWQFEVGLRKRRRLSRPVISVGNLSVGGTGKTPVVRYLCEGLKERGFHPAVLSYGYGGSLAGRLGVVSDGKRVLLTPEEAGDEPVMLASWLPGVPVVVGRHRTESGRVAVDELGADVLVLDDGFQVWKLERDLDIVLLSRANPFDNGRTLPAGRLRESVSAVKRADCIMVTGHQTRVESPDDIGHAAPGVPVYSGRFVPSGVASPSEQAEASPESIRGKRVFVLSSIARPAPFQATLQALGAVVVGADRFADHHLYSEADLARACKLASENGADTIAVTEKDAVKLAGFISEVPVAVIRTKLHLEDEPGFWELVEAGISPNQ